MELNDMVDFVMTFLLAVFVVVLIISLVRAHRGNGKLANFNLIDAFRNREGYYSRPAAQETVVFIVMTWTQVTFVLKGQLVEWFTGLYVGTFVLRAAHAAYMKSKENNVLPPNPPDKLLS